MRVIVYCPDCEDKLRKVFLGGINAIQEPSPEKVHACETSEASEGVRGGDAERQEASQEGEEEASSQERPQQKLLKCNKCGWMHFIDKTGSVQCFSCGSKQGFSFVDERECPRGVTIQPISSGVLRCSSQ